MAADDLAVQTAYRVLGVSESGYYARLHPTQGTATPPTNPGCFYVCQVAGSATLGGRWAAARVRKIWRLV